MKNTVKYPLELLKEAREKENSEDQNEELDLAIQSLEFFEQVINPNKTDNEKKTLKTL
jgi:hypothetical protein